MKKAGSRIEDRGLGQTQPLPLSLTLSHEGRGNKSSGAGDVPASLAKVGIYSVSDNLFPGDTLNVGRTFMAVFGTELEARLIKKGNPCRNNLPCR